MVMFLQREALQIEKNKATLTWNAPLQATDACCCCRMYVHTETRAALVKRENIEAAVLHFLQEFGGEATNNKPALIWWCEIFSRGEKIHTWAALCWWNMHVWTFPRFKSVSLCFSWSDSFNISHLGLIPQRHTSPAPAPFCQNNLQENLQRTLNTPKNHQLQSTTASSWEFKSYFEVCRTSRRWGSTAPRPAVGATVVQPKASRSTSYKSIDSSVCPVCKSLCVRAPAKCSKTLENGALMPRGHSNTAEMMWFRRH